MNKTEADLWKFVQHGQVAYTSLEEMYADRNWLISQGRIIYAEKLERGLYLVKWRSKYSEIPRYYFENLKSDGWTVYRYGINEV